MRKICGYRYCILSVICFLIFSANAISSEPSWPEPPPATPLYHPDSNAIHKNELYRRQLEESREALETQRMERSINNEKYQEGIRTYKEGIDDYRNRIEKY